jgi:hypothetical protein
MVEEMGKDLEPDNHLVQDQKENLQEQDLEIH